VLPKIIGATFWGVGKNLWRGSGLAVQTNGKRRKNGTGFIDQGVTDGKHAAAYRDVPD